MDRRSDADMDEQEIIEDLNDKPAENAGTESSSNFLPSGSSPRMQKLRRQLEQVATFATNVLITGESGTGKEWAARYVHDMSPRRDKPFVPVNCGAIPTELLESELFGHEKGSFTGAVSARVGRFEVAEGGTLFLDEIGDMSLPMQVKILRVLQERIYERVGSNESRACDVRIVAATHRDLEGAIELGKFRADLFYRLNVFPVQMPPLRDRPEDLQILVESILSRCREDGLSPILLTPGALRMLKHHDWPGNIRELANLIERLCVLYPGKTVDISDLPARYTATAPLRQEDLHSIAVARKDGPLPQDHDLPDGEICLRDYLADIESFLIRKALQESDGVVAQAARRLQLRRTTLVEKIKKYSLSASV
ncbi:MAG: sigma-54-dependent Fis family transcriptional regulator [Gammaproteobacteria bacterium]|nr:sigma-54-dependent Fis family transcriptional regulator [Gammaproteobacteria bacterium]